MEKPATFTLVDREIAYRLELCSAWRSVRYAGAYQKLHSNAATSAAPIGGGYAVFVTAESPVSRAVGLGLNGPLQPGDLEALVNFYHSREAEIRLDVSPFADESLIEGARSLGLVPSHFYSVLYRPITDEDLNPTIPPEIFVRQARPDEGSQWLTLTAQGFEETETPEPESFDILGPNFYAKDSACYFAFKDGQPAGGGGMYAHQGVVELGGASTLVQFRRQGVQRALIEKRLADARAQGCDLAMVLTSPGSGSQRNLERTGFRLAYSKIVLMEA
ncbi:MAG: GNAT family N-acetyltransferase [Chloroflexi bacterium]|nr:GNAT family N-acetyltransferase [Chloroflexota bacterium]